MKKPKFKLSKQEYSVLTVLACIVLGCICMLFVVNMQPNTEIVEQVLMSLIVGAIGIFSLALMLWYVAYIHAVRKFGIDKEVDDTRDGSNELTDDIKEADKEESDKT